MTLNCVMAVILRYLSEFGSFLSALLKSEFILVENIPKLLRQKCSPRCLVFSDISLTLISYREAFREFRRGG